MAFSHCWRWNINRIFNCWWWCTSVNLAVEQLKSVVKNSKNEKMINKLAKCGRKLSTIGIDREHMTINQPDNDGCFMMARWLGMICISSELHMLKPVWNILHWVGRLWCKGFKMFDIEMYKRCNCQMTLPNNKTRQIRRQTQLSRKSVGISRLLHALVTRSQTVL